MLDRVRAHRVIVEDASPAQRRKLENCIFKGLLADAESPKEKQWVRDLKRMKTIGFTPGLEYIDSKSRRINGIAFDMPALLLNDPKYPALWIAGVDITEGFTKVGVRTGGDVRDRYSWVNIVRKANSRQLSKLMSCIYDAAEFYNARWRDQGGEPPEWDLISKNKDAVEFVKNLKGNKSLKFMGFCMNNAYMRLDGDKVQLEAEWVHALSAPTLLYRHEFLPLYLVAGIDIMFNNSKVSDIPRNRMRVPLFGVTG